MEPSETRSSPPSSGSGAVAAPQASPPPPTPQADEPAALGFERQPMVDWLAPVQLARIGLQVYMSSAFGSFFDKREIQAVAGGPPEIERDYSGQEEIWFDYVADLGDGFDSTYTVARLLGAAALDVPGAAPLPRGRFLVMGGDQVYPTASREEYLNRFEGPYRAALPWVEGDHAPDLYAIPGNHDWYDGLTNFTRLFCQFGARRDTFRWVGGWRTRQTRSYFALKLPAGWWLWGIDVQLSSYIDKPQIAYFETIAQQMRAETPAGEEPRLILVTPQPGWVGCEERRDGSLFDPGQFDSLEYFESRVIRKHSIRPALVVAGDLHHYCRYRQAAGAAEGAGLPTQRVTSGGGGAYLLGTHQMPKTIAVPEGAGSGDLGQGPRVTYRRAAVYPSLADSRRLAAGVWRLPGRNWRFSLLIGAVYLLFGWTLDLPAHPVNPLSVAFALALAAGFWSFARAQGEPYGRRLPWLGLAHGAAHALLGIGLFAGFSSLNQPIPQPLHSLVLSLEMLAGGFAGALLFAAYLAAASRISGAHTNDVFSSQGIADYKSFLRLHIARDGRLTVHALGIDQVPRRWRLAKEAPAGHPWFEPESGEPPLQARVVDQFEVPGGDPR
jgi:Calcineurin-like phosphoesterase